MLGILLYGFAGAVVALCGIAAAPLQAEELRIGTASQGGAFYPVGQAIASQSLSASFFWIN